MEDFWKKVETILPQVSRPGRYVGNELHAVRKDWQQIDVSFVLAFPDAYEIGMSHVGMGILYHVLNRCDWIAAERVFSPWVDMEDRMRQDGIPLFSLESRRPIRHFDVVGITLQYELQYTNVLNLLDLAGIPVWSKERKDEDPIVVAGGPCAFNPEPLADFFDAVVLGDGEEVVLEIAGVVREAKERKWDRGEILEAFSRLDGVYVPSLFRVKFDSKGRYLQTIPMQEGIAPEIRARILDRLSLDDYPMKPIVPLIEIIHDRFSMEIMRGCTRGCRFCSAGMAYRPVRERRVEDLVKQTDQVLSNTGYDEISLGSLSTSDFRNLSRLLYQLRDVFQDKGISISFPSLRPDTFTPEMADFAFGLRRSGLTLAPEAGTQRLRDVINKNICEEDLIRAVEIGFQKGWRQVKLYFMIGLPTETQEDLEGIVDLVWKVVRVGRRCGKKEVHVSISPFSPKPHTPFQWECQDSRQVLEEKLSFLKQEIKWREVRLSWRDPSVSGLETILGRGDRRLGEVVYRVWKIGARFDAWSDQFDYSLWERVFDDLNFSTSEFVEGKRIGEPLPWDHINKGITKSYLIQERQKAFSAEVTEDCRSSGCKGCGLMEHPVCREVISAEQRIPETEFLKKSELTYGRSIRRVRQPIVKRKVRVGYQKGDEVRFTSHLDTVRIFTRALRRANISVAFSQGYHAHPRIATGPPLPLGYTSRAEYLDLEVVEQLPKNFENVVNRYLPEGFEIFRSRMILDIAPSLNGSINFASYDIWWDRSPDLEGMDIRIEEFLSKNSVRVIRKKKGMEKEVDIRLYVVNMSLKDECIELHLRLGPNGTARVEEVIQAILPPNVEPTLVTKVERTGLYIEEKGLRRNPLEEG